MPLSQSQCQAFNSELFRRTPDFTDELFEDRFPRSYTYMGLYQTGEWMPFHGDSQTWDRIHVTRANDNGCWDQVQIDACLGSPCNPSRFTMGWGSTRDTFATYHRDYVTPPWCFDQLRNTEMAVQQVNGIVKELKKQPNEIWSDFFRLFSLRSSDQIWIAGSANTTVTTTDAMFTNNCTRINLGSTGNLPTSKLTMNYLDNHVEDLMYNGYIDMDFDPTGKFKVMTDLQTLRDNANGNPALTQMYNAADFAKGGQYYAYGVMAGVGNWLFKIDSTPLRFQHLGSGVLQRVFPYENVDTTVGKKPQFSECYKNAPYQMSHVYHPAARKVFLGETTPISAETPFMARSLNGTWTWKGPNESVIMYTDPNTGVQCTLNNDKRNIGYFLGEFETRVQTIYPEIEMNIIHLREPQNIVDDARCAAEPQSCSQDLVPYNLQCFDPA